MTCIPELVHISIKCILCLLINVCSFWQIRGVWIKLPSMALTQVRCSYQSSHFYSVQKKKKNHITHIWKTIIFEICVLRRAGLKEIVIFRWFSSHSWNCRKHLQVKSCFMVRIGCFEVSRLSQWAEVVQSLGWTRCKVCFCSGDTRFSAIRPCCAATTVNECQTFIYTWARVWYSRGHCGSLANPLPPSLKLRGVVFLLLFFFFNPHTSCDEGMWDCISQHKLLKSKWSMTSAGVVICSCHGEKLVFVESKLIWLEEEEKKQTCDKSLRFFICIYIQNAI